MTFQGHAALFAGEAVFEQGSKEKCPEGGVGVKLEVEEGGVQPGFGDWLGVGEELDEHGQDEGDSSVQEQDEGCCFGHHFGGPCGWMEDKKLCLVSEWRWEERRDAFGRRGEGFQGLEIKRHSLV